MPDTVENDFIPEPAKVTATPSDTVPVGPDAAGAMEPGLAIPDLMPLVDVAEGRIAFLMDTCESAIRSAMLVSAAGLECGTIWSRGWREMRGHAATSVWRTSQTAVAASSDMVDRWMDLHVRSMDLAATRLAKTA